MVLPILTYTVLAAAYKGYNIPFITVNFSLQSTFNLLLTSQSFKLPALAEEDPSKL
jgi:hypothetical protein